MVRLALVAGFALALAPASASAQSFGDLFTKAVTGAAQGGGGAPAPAAKSAPLPAPAKIPVGRGGGGGGAAAAGVIGLAGGLIAAGIAEEAEKKAAAEAQASEQAHIDDCLRRYKSYNPRTDTYIGPDGQRHQCR